MLRVSPTSSIAAVQRDSCACSTTAPSLLSILPVTGNTSLRVISATMRRRLFLIDYAQRKRVKIWGEARVVEGNDKLVEALMPKGYRARPEQVILFKVLAWDANCPQHIPQRFEAADGAAELSERDK